MQVILVLGTKEDPGCKVKIEADIKFTTADGLERWIKAQQIALRWLREQKAAGK